MFPRVAWIVVGMAAQPSPPPGLPHESDRALPSTREGWDERLNDPRYLRTSGWGEGVDGLQMRVTAPTHVEENMAFEVSTQVLAHLGKLPPGIKAWNPYYGERNLSLHLIRSNNGTEYVVNKPVFYSPGPIDWGQSAVSFNGMIQDGPKVPFVLVFSGREIPAGAYECFVRYSQGLEPTRDWGNRPEDLERWRESGFWHGTVDSGRFYLELLRETPKTFTFFAPRLLRVVRSPATILPDGGTTSGGGSLNISYGPEDADRVELPVHNGYQVWMFLDVVGPDGPQRKSISGPVRPFDLNGLDRILHYRGGDITQHYRIELIEATTNPHRPAGPYKSNKLWERDFDVTFTEEEIRAAPQAPPYVVPKRDSDR